MFTLFFYFHSFLIQTFKVSQRRLSGLNLKGFTICFILLTSYTSLPLCACFSLFLPSTSYSLENKLLLTSDTLYPAPCYLTYYKEDNGKLTISDILKIPADKFQPIPDCSPNFGIDEKAYWFRLEIRNDHPEIPDWLAEIDLNTLDKINFYQVDSSGNHIEKFAGNLYPVKMKDTRHRNPLFKMKLKSGENYTLYFRAASTTFLGFPLTILSLSRLHEKDLSYQMFFGIFYGIIFIMIIYNLILFFYIKDRSFIYYVMYMAGMTVNFLCINGYYNLLPIPFSEFFNYHVFNLDICFITFSACLFTKTFLNTRTYSPFAHKILNGLIFIILLIVLCEFIIPKQYTVPITDIVTLLTIFVSTGISIYIWKKGYTPAGYYLLAFSTLFVAVIMIILTNFQLLPITWLTLNGMQIASALESVLLSFALGYRMSDLKKGKEDFQKKLITQLQENEKIKDEVNRNLENIVQQRTSALEATNKILSEQKRIIQQKNTDITDSINYAQNIQKAILPDPCLLTTCFPESFILYMPKAIVSGDFYWFSHKMENGQNRFIISVGDCTGHGVPGALMSMIGNTLLNEIINSNKKYTPSDILFDLNNSVKKIIKQENTLTSSKDGMDISICSFQMSSVTRLEFAGAYHPVFHFRNGQLNVLLPDKTAIGGFTSENYSFENHEVEIIKGDTIYLFSDGYGDQFGYDKTHATKKPIKFTKKRFRELLFTIHRLPMKEQREILKQTFEDWKANEEQLDDVLVIGLRI